MTCVRVLANCVRCSDVIGNGHHRALAFGYFGASFSCARIFSAAWAGYVAELAPKGGWMEFTLPCLALVRPLFAAAIAAPRVC